jgi:hypothetical protein
VYEASLDETISWTQAGHAFGSLLDVLVAAGSKMISVSPTPHINIARTHRDPLRAALLVDLTDVDEIGRFIEDHQMTEARGYRDRFMRDMRLLDDLGWEESDPRQSFELTMPAIELTGIIGYLREVAEAELRFWSEDLAFTPDPWMSIAEITELKAGARAHIDLDLDTMAACTAVLYGLRRQQIQSNSNGNGNGNGNGSVPLPNGNGARSKV